VFGLKRREFIALLGSAAAAWPLAGRAQQRAMPVVGWLRVGSPNQAPHLVHALRRGLAETGFVEGQNVTIESRFAENRNDRFRALADDLVRAQVDVIVVPGTTAGALAAQAATKTIPIVFMIGSDPVEIGLVASLARPGGNMTGIGQLQSRTAARRIQMLHELVPMAGTLAWLINPTNPYGLAEAKEVQAAAQALRLELRILNASTTRDIDAAFATLVQQRIGALIVGADAFFFVQRERLVALAARYAVPTISNFREYAVAGGLMSYGNNVSDAYLLVGRYVGRILKGEKPAEMPVMQPTKFELVINLKAARALKLDIPPTLLALADEVIE
jgi:putative ABC transport system substrate-binding protein